MDTQTTTLTRSPYEILKITRWTDEEKIKAQYFHLVKQFNPEYFPDEFIEIRTAYDILRDPHTRAATDIENFSAPPMFYHSDYPDFPRQPLSLFKLNQEMKTVCGEAEPESLQDHSRNQALHLLRGMALYQALHDHLDEAKEIWRRILAMEPSDEESKENLAVATWCDAYEASQNGNYAEAEKQFASLVEEGIIDSAVYQNLALAYEKQGKKEEAENAWRSALKAYNEALKENPNDEYMKALIVALHKYTGGKFLEGGSVSSGTGGAGSAKELGYACIQKGNWRQAMEALEQALRENENDVDVLCQLGWAYLNTNNQNRAFHMWNLALKKAPGKGQVIDHLVRGYTIFGKRLKEQRIFNQALVQFKNALKHEPDNLDIRHHLAETYFQMRNFSAALQEYQRIMDIDPRNKVARQGIREAKRLGGLR